MLAAAARRAGARRGRLPPAAARPPRRRGPFCGGAVPLRRASSRVDSFWDEWDGERGADTRSGKFRDTRYKPEIPRTPEILAQVKAGDTTFNTSPIQDKIAKNAEKSGGSLMQQSEYTKLLYQMFTVMCFSLGGTFLVIPLYRLFCTSATKHGGSTALQQAEHQRQQFEHSSASARIAQIIQVLFKGDLGSKELPLMFLPLQSCIDTLLGEPTLAFFNVYNRTEKTLIGLTTYNVTPPEVSSYFNKIQCFCFEEQRIKPHELIELPVFFFIDKELASDHACATINQVLLTYTFFIV